MKWQETWKRWSTIKRIIAVSGVLILACVAVALVGLAFRSSKSPAPAPTRGAEGYRYHASTVELSLQGRVDYAAATCLYSDVVNSGMDAESADSACVETLMEAIGGENPHIPGGEQAIANEAICIAQSGIYSCRPKKSDYVGTR